MDTLSDLEAAFGFNPNLMRQGQRARVLAEKRDVNTLPDPLTYAALMGLMGIAPDEMGFSALHPKRQDVKRVAEPAFALGTALQVAPAAGALTKLMNATGSAGKIGASAAKQIGAIKPKGGNWLTGSVEDSVKGLKRDDDLVRIARQNQVPLAEERLAETGALNSWVDKQLTRYIKNEMATPEDPVRALAEKGVLHVDPERLNFRPETHGKFLEPGQTALAQSIPAKSWEGASDIKVFNNRAGDFLKDAGRGSSPEPSMTVTRNPWLQKVPPETQVHALSEPRSLPQDLGFDHLIDELRNATNPASGLPPELLLKYSSLPQVSVPQAVERVAKINEWRAAQKAEADLARANNAATVLHKEYPDKGFKWVELKQGEQLPEGWRQDAKGQYISPEGAFTSRNPNESVLQDALKYEGDTMGHCVGGYCDDVASGASRIFSLRDKKGQPHVTIETKPPRSSPYDHWYEQNSHGTPELEDFLAYAKANQPKGGLNEWYKEWASSTGRTPVEPPASIIQIKGKGNNAPNEEYLPYVQDFVKSGKWSDVGDLQNSGLRRTSDAWNTAELKKIQDAGIQVPSHATQAEIDAIGEQVWPGQWGQSQKPDGFARGGSVTAKDPIRLMAEKYAAHCPSLRNHTLHKGN
jgi:hypothetical protein